MGARDSKVLSIGTIERLHQVQAKHGNNVPDSSGLQTRKTCFDFLLFYLPIADLFCKRETTNNRSNSR